MSLYVSRAAAITENDPPVVTAPITKSLTVIVRSGQASIMLGQYSGGTVVLEAGETLTWSTLAAGDSIEQMTIAALGTGARVLAVWTFL